MILTNLIEFFLDQGSPGNAYPGFNPTAFVQQFPAFAAVPFVTLNMYAQTAASFVSTTSTYGGLDQADQTNAYYLAVAHVAQLAANAGAGQPAGFVTEESVKDVRYSVQAPPSENQFQWWLNLTPYGQQLYVLLYVSSIGGFYAGGLPETTAFRKFGGIGSGGWYG